MVGQAIFQVWAEAEQSKPQDNLSMWLGVLALCQQRHAYDTGQEVSQPEALD